MVCLRLDIISIDFTVIIDRNRSLPILGLLTINITRAARKRGRNSIRILHRYIQSTNSGQTIGSTIRYFRATAIQRGKFFENIASCLGTAQRIGWENESSAGARSCNTRRMECATAGARMLALGRNKLGYSSD